MGVVPTRQLGSGRRENKPFQPAIGTDIGSVDDADARTRDFLAKTIAVFAGSAIAVTGVYGLIMGNYTPVVAVWAIAGPIIGALVTYYFGPRRNDTG
jgi:hypothetical protein